MSVSEGGSEDRAEVSIADRLIVVDDFYSHPDAVRALALRSRFTDIQLSDYPGYASHMSVANDALLRRLEGIMGCRIVADPSRFSWGEFRFISEQSGMCPNIHADAATDWAAMVYLTPNAPPGAGTGFFRHKVTGMIGPPTEREARRMGYADSSEYDDMVVQPDKTNLSRWDLVESVDPVYNRLVLFKGSELFHAPLGGGGSAKDDARLTHVFFFNVVDSVTQHGRSSGTVRPELPKSPRPLVRFLAEDTGLDTSPHMRLTCHPPRCNGAGTLRDIAEEALEVGSVFDDAQQLDCNSMNLRELILLDFDALGSLRDAYLVDLLRCLREGRGHVDLTGIDLRGANLEGADLSHSRLEGADLRGANLARATLEAADCREADFSGANLYSASLKGSDLTAANLGRTDLRHADLRQAVCVRTALRGADLWNSYTWGLDLSEAYLEGVDRDRADNLSSSIGSKVSASEKTI